MNKENDREINSNEKQNKISEDTEFDKKFKEQVDSVKRMFDAYYKNKEKSNSKNKEKSEEERD